MPSRAPGASAKPAEREERTQVPGALHAEHGVLERSHAGRRQEARGVVPELRDDLLLGDGPIGAPSLALLARLEHPAVREPYLDPAGKSPRIGRRGIYRVPYSGSQGEHALVAEALLAEGADAHAVPAERRRDTEREAEFGVVGCPRPELRRDWLADDGHFPGGDEAFDLPHLLHSKTFGSPEARHCVEIGVAEMAAGIELERAPHCLPLISQILQLFFDVWRFTERCTVEAEPSLERRCRPGEALCSERGRLNPRLSRPSGMEPLDPGAILEELHDSRSHARSDAEGRGQAVGVEAEGLPRSERRPEGAADACGVPAAIVKAPGGRHTDPDHGLVARAQRRERVAAAQSLRFRQGKHRRHQHGRSVADRVSMRVVEVEAVGEGAVGERGLRRCGRERRAPDGAEPGPAPARRDSQHGPGVLLPRPGQRAAYRVEDSEGRIVTHGSGDVPGAKPLRPLAKPPRSRRHLEPDCFPRGSATVAEPLAVISLRWFSATRSTSTSERPPSSRFPVTIPRHQVTSPIRLWRRTWAESRLSWPSLPIQLVATWPSHATRSGP